MAYNFFIEYKKGVDNTVVDSFLRKFEDSKPPLIRNTLISDPDRWKKLAAATGGCTKVQIFINEMLLGSQDLADYSYIEGLLRYKGNSLFYHRGTLRGLDLLSTGHEVILLAWHEMRDLRIHYAL